MIELMRNQKVTVNSVVDLCGIGSRLKATGLSGIGHIRGVLGGSERPTTALVAAPVWAPAYAFALAAEGADAHQKRRQSMRAFRGLKPWREPA
ncbi:hypothetical protein [Streptomyces sulphureus]|uniref:hypothetical protein n=1 Tax=Streptomyces sulphureus TaxID=47758 RepID=UPI001FE234AA|nr:hypothetical protein [Streptomyces sulphureus]